MTSRTLQQRPVIDLTHCHFGLFSGEVAPDPARDAACAGVQPEAPYANDTVSPACKKAIDLPCEPMFTGDKCPAWLMVAGRECPRWSQDGHLCLLSEMQLYEEEGMAICAEWSANHYLNDCYLSTKEAGMEWCSWWAEACGGTQQEKDRCNYDFTGEKCPALLSFVASNCSKGTSKHHSI